MSLSWLRVLLDGVIQLVYPGCCHLCGNHIPEIRQAFCDTCQAELLSDPATSCPHCAATIGLHASTAGGCFHCRGEKFPFDTALRLGPYAGRLRELILRLKHPRGQFLAEIIAELWARWDQQRFQGLGIDAVVPVPSHWRRRWWTGCHPVGTLGQRLALRLRLPYHADWLIRTRWTTSQIGLSNAERRANVRAAFQLKKNLRLDGKTILLVDDVMTTGSTVREAAQPLRRAGAGRVIVGVLARVGDAAPA